jgi:hypothetical protein
MKGNRCVHGIDDRFCAVCNRTSKTSRPRGAIGSATLPEILAFLNAAELRATSRAVGDLIGVSPIAMGRALGPHTVEASWIVSAATGLPTDYRKDEMHPSLLRTDEIIDTGTGLIMRMTAWKAQAENH